MGKKLKIIVIVGPTSSGKTNLSLKLAKKFNGIIISADSRQIYKELDIATAKTTKNQQQGIPHYMIDIINPDDDFNVQLYQDTVYNFLNSISNKKRGKTTLPFIVGGTGLYIRSIVDGYKMPRVKPDKTLRAKLEKLSIDKLAEKLKKLDPKTKVDLKNKRRIIRAIEVVLALGKTVSQVEKPNFEFLQIGISLPIKELYERTEKKVDQMYEEGLVKETKKLIDKEYDFNSPALSSLGYKHIRDYLKHRITLKKALELMKRDTKKYVKRQLTWFKKDKQIHWIKNYKEAEKLIQDFIR